MNLNPRKAQLSRLAPVAGVIVGASGIAFVARTLVTKWDDVTAAFSGVDPLPLAASTALGLAAMSLIGSLWSGMLRTRGHHAPGRKAMAWYFVGQLGKYVPGGIWPVVGRAEMSVRGGVERPDAYKATGLSLLTTYAAAPAAAGLGALLTGDRTVTGATVLIAYVLLWADMGNAGFTAAVARILSRATRRDIVFPPRNQFIGLVAAHVPAWVLMSLSTSVTANAFGARISVAEMLFVTSLSWLVGFLVPGVPGGIGVRESVFTALAGPTVGAGLAVSLALASRVVFIAVDLIGAAASTAVAGGTRASSTEV